MNSLLFSSLIVLCVSCASSLRIKTREEQPTLPRKTTEAPVPKKWALLVAGSNGWGNYRHQADICHAYQILRKNGFLAENIITMMYDDIANDKNNPTPGVIINSPNGTDVYKGVVIDYRENDVTPENFLKVLQGKKSLMSGIGSGKVIESGPDDYIFVNFADHGGDHILCFPNDVLHSKDLISALNNMTDEKRYNKMFLYIEACEAGSMFESLLKDTTNIFVMAAATPDESSYACYWDDKMEVFLGDLFSVNWMHQVEIEKLSTVSLHHIFERVRTKTTKSHAEEYGDLDIGSTKVSEVIGESKQVDENEATPFVDPNLDAVPQPEAKTSGLQLALESAIKRQDQPAIRKYKKLLSEEIRKRLVHMKKLNDILAKLTNSDPAKIKLLEQSRVAVNDEGLECYKTALEAYLSSCLNFPEREFMYPSMKYFLRLCHADWTHIGHITNAIKSACH
ncbi:legumain-like [Planococcus citri]|uniref:legumain-like n=1 Tax=Planococcus citri TaxID=170843 RepID=UPI0031F97553